MTLNDLEPQKRGFSEFFLQFLAAVHISTVNCSELEIGQNNLHIKFLALILDFSSSSSDPLGSRRLAQASVKDIYPLKDGYFTRCWLV